MLKILSEISATQADLIKSFAIFYLLLVGNYIGTSIFTCFQIRYIKAHKWIQLLISFLLVPSLDYQRHVCISEIGYNNVVNSIHAVNKKG